MQYDGEGWGLTHDGRQLIMSDGSATIRFRDPQTFAVTREIEVRDDGVPVPRLNELEYIDGEIWANIWYDDRIARISPAERRGARLHRPRARCIRRARAAAKRC